jgi:hypothetical protein
MVELRIPKEYQRGFAEIRWLGEGQVQGLISALEDEPATVNRAALHSRIAAKVDTIARGGLDKMIDTLVSLYTLRDGIDLDTPGFADAVCDAMDESGSEDLEFANEDEREAFKVRLIRLLGIDLLDTSAKANGLLYDHEHTVHAPPRVLTDVRPIFGTDPADDPKGAVITHTLKITYHEGGRVREFFVALDPDQVDELIGVLERANLKAESLKRTLAGTDVSYIDGE